MTSAVHADVERRTMDRLEHRRISALGIDVAGRCDSQAAGQCRCQVAEDVGVQVGDDEGVERRRTIDHAGGGHIDEFLVPGDVRERLTSDALDEPLDDHEAAIEHGKDIRQSRLPSPNHENSVAVHALERPARRAHAEAASPRPYQTGHTSAPSR